MALMNLLRDIPNKVVQMMMDKGYTRVLTREESIKMADDVKAFAEEMFGEKAVKEKKIMCDERCRLLTWWMRWKRQRATTVAMIRAAAMTTRVAVAMTRAEMTRASAPTEIRMATMMMMMAGAVMGVQEHGSIATGHPCLPLGRKGTRPMTRRNVSGISRGKSTT
jgi:predicted nucleic acid-binding Zn ribbon protein